MKPYVVLFDRIIPLYGVFIFMGAALATGLALLLCKRRGIDRFDVAGVGVYVLAGAFVGAKLLFILVSIKEIIELKLSFFDVMRGGFVFYGGLIGGIIAVLIYAKQFKRDFIEYLDFLAAFVPLGHAIGRLGCLFGGCCYGIEYDGPFSIQYATSISHNTPVGVPLFPVQLLESLLLLLLFAGTIFLLLSNAPKGNVALTYAASYAVIRFSLEFLRGDAERGIFLTLSTSQWISMIIFALSIFMIFLKKKHSNFLRIFDFKKK